MRPSCDVTKSVRAYRYLLFGSFMSPRLTFEDEIGKALYTRAILAQASRVSLGAPRWKVLVLLPLDRENFNYQRLS